ncbi:MAG: hypothetical protein IJS57_06010 [Paludibacteraceae bacterium]|nr:hypothetical protein [Paludibacteraceae bacterium]
MRKIFSFFAAILFAGSMMATDYQLVTSASDLEAGAHYVIGAPYNAKFYVMSTTDNGNNRKMVEATMADGVITGADDILTLTLGGAADAWTFATDNYLGTAGYLNATSTTGSNYLKVVADLDAYAYFTIAIADGVTTVTCNGKDSRNILYLNGTTCFACYNNQTGAQYVKPSLYKEVQEGPKTYWTVAGDSEVAFGTTWAPTNKANDMVKQEDGSYKWEKTELELAAGSILFKVCKDHSWDEAYPTENYELAISEGAIYTVTITFNPDSKEIAAVATKTGEAVVIPSIAMHGNFTGSWKDTEKFELAEGKATASLALTLAEGSYEFGMRIGGSGNWTSNGAAFTRENPSHEVVSGSGNLTLAADAAGEYLFTWTFETNTLAIQFPKKVDPNQMYVWNGNGVTKAEDAIELGGAAEAVQADGTNIEVGVKQKGNWCLKANKGFNSGAYYLGIAMDNAVNAGDTVKIAYFRTTTKNTYVLGLDFSADKASAATTYQILTEGDPQALEADGIPADVNFIVPEGVENAKYLRIYRNTGGTGLWVSKVEVVKAGDTPTPPTPPTPVTLPVVALAGGMNGWSADANILVAAEDSLSASVKVALEAGDVEFKIVSDGKWLSLNGEDPDGLYTFHRDWTTASHVNVIDGRNFKLTADVAGDYIFTWTYADSTLAITFPAKEDPVVVELQAVSAAATWDFSKITANTANALYNNNGIQLTDESTPSKNDEVVYANYSADFMTFAEGFDATTMAFKGEYPIRKNQYCQAGTLHFKTTVAGKITVKFSDTGTSASATAVKRYLVVNGEQTEYWTSRENNGTEPYDAKLNVTTDEIAVPAGDVTITGSSAIVVYNVTFTPSEEPTPTAAVTGDMTEWGDPIPFELSEDKKKATLFNDNIKAGSYEFKMIINGEWRSNGYTFHRGFPGCAGITGNTEANMTVTIDVEGAYTFEWYFENDSLAIIFPAKPEPVLTNGYYLMGSFNDWKAVAENLFQSNLEAEGEEYVLSINLTAGDEIKVAYVEADAATTWFPKEDNYTVDANHSGATTMYFRPVYNEEWAAFGGYFYIVPTSTTGIEEILSEGKAVKIVREGNLIILKGDKAYNAMGQIVK